MTREQLTAIAERLNGATSGPWIVDGASVARQLPDGTPSFDPVVDYVYENADAEFIAHARVDVLDLLTYIDELERRNAQEPRGPEAAL